MIYHFMFDIVEENLETDNVDETVVTNSDIVLLPSDF